MKSSPASLNNSTNFGAGQLGTARQVVLGESTQLDSTFESKHN